jgi:hypothetical protein
MKAAAVAGCRMAVVHRAEQHYRKRHNLQKAPANFLEQNALVLEPILATCDCTYDHLEREYPADFFITQSEQARSRVEELASNECAVPLNKKPASISDGRQAEQALPK